MPGFTLVKNTGSSEANFLEKMERFNKGMSYRHDYKLKELFVSDSYSLYFNAYQEYPFTQITIDDYRIFIEGKIYNLNDIELAKVFKTIVNLSISGSNNMLIRQELEKLDGEFLAVIVDTASEDLYLYNDIFGHLPSYYYMDEERFLFSREFSLIYSSIDNLEIDKIGVVQSICLSYNIGKRTNYKNCNYLLPGTEIQCKGSEINISQIYEFDFESLSKNRVSFKNSVSNLSDLFQKACVSRMGNATIVAISGGLDSRLIAGVLQNDEDIYYVTRLCKSLKEKKEVKIAREIVSDFNLNYEVFNGIEGTKKGLESLILIKSGFNSLENAFNLSYEVQVKQKYGRNINYLTGDGGDRIKPHVKFSKVLQSDLELAKLVFDKNCKLPLGVVCKSFGVAPQDLFEDLNSYLKDLPENDFRYKYIHFMIYESAFKYVFEGGDRKREFFWTTTPFYQTDFFIASMSTPESYKKHYKLFRGLLASYNKRLLTYKNEDWNISFNSWKFKVFMPLSDLIFKYTPRRMKRLFKSSINTNDVYDYNMEVLRKHTLQADSSFAIKEPLSILMQINKKSISVFWTTLTPFLVELYHKDRKTFDLLTSEFQY